MAAPHVAGLAAGISSNPSLSAQKLRQLIVSGTIGRAAVSSRGSINATTTVAYAAAGVALPLQPKPPLPAQARVSLSGSASYSSSHFPTATPLIDYGTTRVTALYSLTSFQAAVAELAGLAANDTEQRSVLTSLSMHPSDSLPAAVPCGNP